jgi:hypothetical protein
MSVSYIREKLGAAVNTMATSSASIQKRLEWAAIAAHTISNRETQKDFPTEELRERWAAWWGSITSKPPRHADEGSIVATISQLSDDEAEKVAEELFNIYDAVMRESLART